MPICRSKARVTHRPTPTEMHVVYDTHIPLHSLFVQHNPHAFATMVLSIAGSTSGHCDACTYIYIHTYTCAFACRAVTTLFNQTLQELGICTARSPSTGAGCRDGSDLHSPAFPLQCLRISQCAALALQACATPAHSTSAYHARVAGSDVRTFNVCIPRQGCRK